MLRGRGEGKGVHHQVLRGREPSRLRTRKDAEERTAKWKEDPH